MADKKIMDKKNFDPSDLLARALLLAVGVMALSFFLGAGLFPAIKIGVAIGFLWGVVKVIYKK